MTTPVRASAIATVIELSTSARDDILALEERSAPDIPFYYRYVHDVRALDYILNNPDACQAYGIYVGHTLVAWGSYRNGWAGQNKSDEGVHEISSLVVDTAYRRKGFGALLLKHMIQALWKKPECHMIYLTVYPNNIPALMLYLSEGFEIYDYRKDMYGPGVHRVFLKLDGP